MSHQDPSTDLAQARVAARELVVATLPGIAFASVAEAAKFLGIAEITLRHKISGKTGIAEIALRQSNKPFPLPTRRFGDRRLIPVSALIEFYAQSLLEDSDAKPNGLDKAFDVALEDALEADPPPPTCKANKDRTLGAPRKAPRWLAMNPASSPAG